jgi:hypothetical protein
MISFLRTLIRETLLLEEVYGVQATVYHGTKADPQALISSLLKDEFKAGAGAGGMYGKGLYTIYEDEKSLADTNTGSGHYGDHVIKLKVNLYGYIIFDPDIALKVYKKPLTPSQQAEEVGYNETVIHSLEGIRLPQYEDFTSDSARSVSKELQHEVKDLVFTGMRDGKVVVIYDPTTAVPMAWKRVARNGRAITSSWKLVDRAALLEPRERLDVSDREGRPVQQSALRRSAMGDFEAGKWDLKSVLKRLAKLPKEQRIVKGDLDLDDSDITSLPDNLQVGGNLDLYGTSITSLPDDLYVGWDLDLSYTRITSLPDDLQVGGGIYGLPRKYWENVPGHLKDKLR